MKKSDQNQIKKIQEYKNINIENENIKREKENLNKEIKKIKENVNILFNLNHRR